MESRGISRTQEKLAPKAQAECAEARLDKSHRLGMQGMRLDVDSLRSFLRTGIRSRKSNQHTLNVSVLCDSFPKKCSYVVSRGVHFCSEFSESKVAIFLCTPWNGSKERQRSFVSDRNGTFHPTQLQHCIGPFFQNLYFCSTWRGTRNFHLSAPASNSETDSFDERY